MRNATGFRAVVAIALFTASATFGQSFVNWESPHVSPIDLTPDGSTLLVVNTADNRLEVYTITSAGVGLIHAGSIPVGLDPVSVRARTDTEAWVANAISDSVSVVDLTSMNVVATLYPGDEPADVVFAGSSQRAFVSVSQLNEVKVYDPSDLSIAPIMLKIEGEDPRAMVTDGTNVYVAIFESGNRTTVLDQVVVSDPVNPYSGDPNPPPNAGAGFDPPIGGALPTPPATSLIIKKDGAGLWRDVNGADWSAAVTWDLHDHDVAIINANSLSITYATGLMNANMAMGLQPSGNVTVIGTDGINEVRFEPNVAGIFLRVLAAEVTGAGAPAAVVDLNPHLTYTSPTESQSVRDQSIGDPRGIAWRAGGTRAFITGMGSNNVIVVDGSLGRVGLIEVGEGPTGLVIGETEARVYVLNKFEGSISVLDADGLTELATVPFHDPTPDAIRLGRPFLYDTHRTSGLGQASCASCHIDGRMDQVAWDLGDPSGAVKTFNQVCNFGLGGCEDWHPMKGPMTTQTLIGIIGTEPLHWRGDRENLAAFNPAFESLMGDDTQLTALEMAQYEAFVATLTPAPNPFRNIDGSLSTTPINGGNAVTGENLFLAGGLDGIECVTCHALPSGTNGQLTSGPALQESQSIKIPQLRNMYEKTGFDAMSLNNNRGYGFIHDGSVDTLVSFLQFPAFQFAGGPTGDQQRRDVDAFLMSFATDTHAGVGVNATVPNDASAFEPATPSQLVTLAAGGAVGLVAKGIVSGEHRGYYLIAPDTFQSDRQAEVVTAATLIGGAAPGAALTFTVVPAVSEVRIGVDRDEDGFFDGDELHAGSDPADPDSTPDNTVIGDVNDDCTVNVNDLVAVLFCFGDPATPPCDTGQDITQDGVVNVNDLLEVLSAFGDACP